MAQTYLLFRFGTEVIGLPSQVTRQAVPLVQVTPIPAAGELLLGVMDVGGRVVPLINLALLSGIDASKQRLGMLTEVAGEGLILPIDEVIGHVTVDQAVSVTDLLSPEVELDFQPARILNPEWLLNMVSSRLSPV